MATKRLSRRALRDIADKLQGGSGPPQGYPALEKRLYMGWAELHLRVLRGYLAGKVFEIPPGHDAIASRNRDGTDMDEEYLTGDEKRIVYKSRRVKAKFWREKVWKDQHGRTFHPYFKDLLRLRATDGTKIGIPTGLGAFYHESANPTDDAVIFRWNTKTKKLEVLLGQRADNNSQAGSGRWGVPGGYREKQDYSTDAKSKNDTREAAIACARREAKEELGVDLSNIEPIIVRDRIHQIGRQATLHAFTETTAVAFFDKDNVLSEQDIRLDPKEVQEARWFDINSVLEGLSKKTNIPGRDPWPEHLEHIRAAITHPELKKQLPKDFIIPDSLVHTRSQKTKRGLFTRPRRIKPKARQP